MINKIDHIYVETTKWDAAVAFWNGLGFEFVEQWGEDGHRAGRLCRADAQVVLAEASGNPVGPTVHFDLSAAEASALNDRLSANDAVDVQVPLEDTHWGTKWIRVKDPDGNVYALEAKPAK